MQSPNGNSGNRSGLLSASNLPVVGSNRHLHSRMRNSRSSISSDASELSTSSISRLGALASNFTSSLGNIGRGPFDDWNRFEIVEALIQDGQTLRDENYLTVSVLRSFAERVFGDRDDFPERPQAYPPDVVNKRNAAAMIIQNSWFCFVIKKAERERQALIAEEELANQEHSPGRPRPNRPRSVRFTPPDTVDPCQYVDGVNLRELGVNQVDDEDDDYDDDTSDDEEKTAATRSVLEQEWVPPSWDYARMYADYNHPRKGGVGGSLMPWLRTTTGRHCMTGSWGEQCDMFEEKQVSELGRYGPGITNYFKFLKWCFWIFLVLACLYMPVLILNTFGRSVEEGARLHDLSQTMAGNLGDTNSTESVHFPGCNDNIRGQDCDFDKSRVALLYAYIDFLGTVVVIIGFLWLRVFEAKEEIVLDKNTVSAASYTVAVKGFSQGLKFSEAELKKHFAEVTGQAVSGVSIAYDNEREIYLYRKRGELMKERVRCTQEYRYHRSLQKKGNHISQEFLLHILSKRVKATAAMREIDNETERLARRQDRPIYAFVTFEHAIGSRVAIRAYNNSIWGYLRMKPSLKFKGSRIRVQSAAEPSTIIWENLKYRRMDRMQRRLLTTSITVILLIISAFTNIIARVLEQSATDTGGNHDCPDSFFDMSEEEQRQDVKENDDLLHCYCDQFTLLEQREDSECREYFTENLIADLFVYFAALVVLITNSGIDMFLKASAKYEKHHSADAMEKSIFLRMFLLKLINTGILFLFMSSFSRVNLLFGLTYEDTGDFTATWYQTVGVSICLVQIGNIVSPHLWKLYKYREGILKRRAAAKDPLKGALTQDELNQLHLGPDFFVSHRYAQVVADLFVCYMFCAGMPILTIIAMLNFYVSYWVDKYLFLRYYRSPPRYKANIGKNATAILPYAIAVHLCVSIWTLGNRRLFATSDQDTGGVDVYGSEYNSYDISDKVGQRHTFPLFVLLILVLFGIILGQLAEQIISYMHIIAKSCCGSVLLRSEFYKEMERFLFNTIHISYSRAVRRGIIKGLATYNILQNPRYKEAFAITDGFALAHGRVKSLRNFGRISFEGLQELEQHERESVTSSLATPDTLSLAGRRSGSTSNGAVQIPRRPRATSADTDTASVASDNSATSKKKKKKTSAEQRTEIVLRTLAEEEEMGLVLGDEDAPLCGVDYPDDMSLSSAVSESSRLSRGSTQSDRHSSQGASTRGGRQSNAPALEPLDEAKEYVPREVVGVLVSRGGDGLEMRTTLPEPTDAVVEERSPLISSRKQNTQAQDDFDIDIRERPVSAYVDMRASYGGVIDREMRGLPDETNPMKEGRTRRAKAATITNPYQAFDQQKHVVHRRPSPEDKRNIEQFQMGRSSKRAAGKTQL